MTTNAADADAVHPRLIPMILGFMVSKAITAAAELDIAERLSQAPRTAEELAKDCSANARNVYRLLRTLASLGIFREDEAGRFHNTDMSDALREDVPNSLKSWCRAFGADPGYSAWDETTYSVRTGGSGFTKVHGSHPFEYFAQHPEAGRDFGMAMTSLTGREHPMIHQNLNFSAHKTLVDIGGGDGSFLVSCLEKNPEQRGILFDRSDVFPRAQALVGGSSVGDRIEIVPGDFFKEIPSGADAYSLKYILHDWSDAEATTILKNIHRACRPGTKLYVMDMVIEPGNAPSYPKVVDMFVMIYYGGGTERTKVEFGRLLENAGFRMTRVQPTGSFISTIEAVRE